MASSMYLKLSDIHLKKIIIIIILSIAGLNYRRLTDESLDPLATLEPVLTSQNVLSISKLANRLPLPGGGGATVSPSAVHAIWLQKMFWKGDVQLLKRPPQSDQDYLHAYDTCAKYLDRLVPADAANFLDRITFSPDAVKHVSAKKHVIVFFSLKAIYLSHTENHLPAHKRKIRE